MSTANAIQFDAVTKRFSGRPVLDGLSFAVPPGSITLLAGPNGSGKTTAIGVLLGLVRPAAGTAGFGSVIYRDLPRPLARVGVVSDAISFDPRLSGRTALELTARAAGLPTRTADAALRDAGLASADRTPVGDYSLGMARRLAIAAALLPSPPVLVLDEPASGLDAEGTDWFLERVREHRARGGSALLVTHARSEAALLADRLVGLRDGRAEPATDVPASPPPGGPTTPAADLAEVLR